MKSFEKTTIYKYGNWNVNTIINVNNATYKFLTSITPKGIIKAVGYECDLIELNKILGTVKVREKNPIFSWNLGEHKTRNKRALKDKHSIALNRFKEFINQSKSI